MEKKIILILFILFLFNSCTKDDSFSSVNDVSTLSNNLKEKSILRFSEILSKVTYNRKDVRVFLKKRSFETI